MRAVFVSTGGKKLLRAIRSFRRIESTMPISVVLDLASHTWYQNLYAWSELREVMEQYEIDLVSFPNKHYINGAMNKAMECADGSDVVAVFHDDVVFPPRAAAIRPPLRFNLAEEMTALRCGHYGESTVALSLNLLECYGPHGAMHMPPAYWDAMDLESPVAWQPWLDIVDRMPHTSALDSITGKVPRVRGTSMDVQSICVRRPVPWLRLGPCGFILKREAWLAEPFETDGVFYDVDFVMQAWRRGWGIVAIPMLPLLHLHNQSIGIGQPDAASQYGIWNQFSENFLRKYGVDWVEHSTTWAKAQEGA